METKKIKRPIAPAIFLLLSVLTAVILLFVNGLNLGINTSSYISQLNTLFELPEDIREPHVFYVLLNIASTAVIFISYLAKVILNIFPLVLCIILFQKKRNKLLVTATGAYILMPVGFLISYVLQWAVEIIIRIIRSSLNYGIVVYNDNYFGIVTSLLSYILFISAAVMMFIVSLSVLENPNKPSKIIKFLKFLFWLPALLYFFNFIFQEATTVSSWINTIIVLSKHGEKIFDILLQILRSNFITYPLSLIGSLCTLLFFLTYGLWLFNPYKKEKKFSKSIKKETVEENNLKEPQNINK